MYSCCLALISVYALGTSAKEAIVDAVPVDPDNQTTWVGQWENQTAIEEQWSEYLSLTGQTLASLAAGDAASWQGLCAACVDTLTTIDGMMSGTQKFQEAIKAPALHICQVALATAGFGTGPIPGTRLICQTMLFSDMSPFKHLLDSFRDKKKTSALVHKTCHLIHACSKSEP
ncbi:unnamed protein product, partial [Mesorhabditis spiculigera]